MASTSGHHHVPGSPGQQSNFYDKQDHIKGLCLVHRKNGGVHETVFQQKHMIFIMCAMNKLDLGSAKTRALLQEWDRFYASPGMVEEVVAHIEMRHKSDDQNSDAWKNCWSQVIRIYQKDDWVDYIKELSIEYGESNSNTRRNRRRY